MMPGLNETARLHVCDGGLANAKFIGKHGLGDLALLELFKDSCGLGDHSTDDKSRIVISSITNRHLPESPSPIYHEGMTPLAQRIKDARKSAGLTQAALGKKVAQGQTTVQGWESGRNEPDLNKLDDIAKATGVSADWLKTGKGHLELKSTSVDNNSKDVATPNQGGLEFVRDGHLRFIGPRDLPILGYVKAGELGFFIVNGERQGVTVRPEALRDVMGAYAVRVHDESMMRALRPGYLLFVDPTRPTKPGDLVIIQMRDGQSFIKELVRRTEKATMCLQYNPEKEIKYDPQKVKSVHLVVQISTIDI